MPVPTVIPGANAIRTTTRLDDLVFDKNVDIPLRDGGLCRANVYKPLVEGRYPVIMTMGPYGKDVPYSEFHVKSFRELPDEQKGPLSAWETPHPNVSRSLVLSCQLHASSLPTGRQSSASSAASLLATAFFPPERC